MSSVIAPAYGPFRKFGERLAKARVAAGYTSQPQLARVMGLNHNTICRHELGKSLPAPKYMRLYAELLHIEESELQYGLSTFSAPPGSVIDYLMTPEARGLLDETRDRLLRVSWSVLSDSPISRAQVATIAQLIDHNLRRAEALSDAQLHAGAREIPAGAWGAHP